MLERSRTGQVPGFLIKNWVPMTVDKFIAESSGGVAGIEFAARNLMKYNPRVIRVVFNAGPPIDSIPRLCRNFADEDVETVYLPRWFIADFLIKSGENYPPISLTMVQVAGKPEEGSVGLRVYVNRTCKENTNEVENNKDFWEELRFAFAKLGLEEFWNRITGTIKPSMGVLDKGRKGLLYLSETDFHYCFIGNEEALIEGIDQTDLTRLEQLLDSAGLPKSEFLKVGVSREYIVRTISQLGETGLPPELDDNIQGENKQKFREQNL